MAEVSKTGDAMGRGSWRSSFLGAPGAEFLRETSARKNFLGTGATSPPSPRFPGTWGEGRKIQATASVPKKTVSLEGCTSFIFQNDSSFRGILFSAGVPSVKEHR